MTEQPEMTERERDQIDAAYYKRFNSYPPIWWWRGSRADLVAVMVETIERDQPLTAKISATRRASLGRCRAWNIDRRRGAP